MASKPRASEEQSERFQMRVSPQLVKAIDDWRRRQADLPSRSEATRRLLEQALEIKPTPRPKPGGTARR